MIIALGHRKRVGKDMCCQLLTELAEENKWPEVNRIGFADKLKVYAHILFGEYNLGTRIDYEVRPDLIERPLRVINKSPRQIWIELGMKMREIHEDYWIEQAFTLIDNDKLNVITDLRFPNEATALKSRGAKLVKIVNPWVPDNDNVADNALTDYEGWDYMISNSGTKEELKSKLLEIMKELDYAQRS